MTPTVHRMDKRRDPPRWVEITLGNIVLRFARTDDGATERLPRKTLDHKGRGRRSATFIRTSAEYADCVKLARQALHPKPDVPWPDALDESYYDSLGAKPLRHTFSCPHCGYIFAKGMQIGDRCPGCDENPFATEDSDV